MQGLVPSCSKEKEKRGKVGAMLRGGGGFQGCEVAEYLQKASGLCQVLKEAL